MNIVVLAGGTSTERAISIVSGTQVCKALRSKGHHAVLVDIFGGIQEEATSAFFDADPYDLEAAVSCMHSYDDKLEEIAAGRRSFFGPGILELCSLADVVFMALHGSNGEDGKVQAAFDLMGISYTGTDYLSSALAMDKGLTKQMFYGHHVPTPHGCILRANMNPELSLYDMELPVVVKPCCGGSSVGVTIAKTGEEYEKALKESFSYEPECVVEEYIDGREFSIGVVGGKAYPIIEIAPIEGFYDYTNKYKAGSTIETCPADLTPEQTKEMQGYAELGAKALGITCYCRLDFLMRPDGRMYCLEANTLPGMTPTSLLPQEAAALGIGYPELCELLIQLSVQKS